MTTIFMGITSVAVDGETKRVRSEFKRGDDFNPRGERAKASFLDDRTPSTEVSRISSDAVAFSYYQAKEAA
jgi:hypothetical protein